jgi:hypothetical protein
MDKESTELILQHLDKLAEKLGVGVGKIWPWFVRQVYIDSIQSTFLMLISISLFIGCTVFMCKHWKETESKYSIYSAHHEAPWIISLVFFGIITLICTIAFFSFGFNFLNPEYHAFKNIISIVK